ncbi:MAG TPA: BlaI/MecI/CopY family transcriptional regulator [Isosphaeraceae bacterium]|nr:BlaI/MecI/CopY family transcriptional regulator [Isosphaeraceae bacterium]
MPRLPSETLTGRESEIMDVLWNLGEATAEQVREELSGSSHDSTVRTLLRVLERKGYAAHEVRGKAYLYRAVVPRQKAQRRALRTLLARFFGGSAEDLVLRLIEDERITPEQLDALREAASQPKPRPGRRRGTGPDRTRRREGGER